MYIYVKSPSGKVHIAFRVESHVDEKNKLHQTFNRDETLCGKKITDEWDTDNDDLFFRSHRLEVTGFTICLECDKDRNDLYKQFSPFPNSTHLT